MRRRGKALTNDGGPLWNNMGKLKMVSEGERVPNAPLEGVDGQTFTLERYAERPLVLYFYPKADTPGCTNERSEEHTSELPSLMRISYDVFCLKKNKEQLKQSTQQQTQQQ